MRTVGIDIGSYSIKVAEVESHLKSTTLRDFYEIPLNHEPGQDVRLEKIEALKKIAYQYDQKNYRIVVGLGSEHSTQRIVTFPFLERSKITQSLPIELEDAIPFSQESAIFDFRIITQRTSSSQVLAMAVPKKYIQELLLLCEDAGLDPDVVSLDGIALSNLFENYLAGPRQSRDAEESAPIAEIVIYLGYSKTLINVMQSRAPLASRAIYFGGRDLASQVSRSYQLPYLEALKGVAEKGFVLTASAGASEEQVMFSNVIGQSLSTLVNELRRTLVDLKAELKIEISRGHLMGGMSRLINLGPYLSQELQLPVGVHNHLGEALRSDIVATDENEKASAIAVGLAIEGLRKPKNPAINLRRNEFSRQNQNFKLIWDQYKTVAQLGAVLLFFLFIYSSMRSGFIEDNIAVVEKVIQDQGKNPSLGITKSQLRPEALKKFIKSKKEEMESKKEVARLNKMTSALDVMKSVSSALPPRGQISLDIKHFYVDGDRFILEGLVGSSGEFDLLQKRLVQNPIVSQLKVGGAPPAPAGKFAFQVSMNVSRLPPAEKRPK